jgi:hypothetical protein
MAERGELLLSPTRDEDRSAAQLGCSEERAHWQNLSDGALLRGVCLGMVLHAVSMVR